MNNSTQEPRAAEGNSSPRRQGSAEPRSGHTSSAPLSSRLEAILFAADRPLTGLKLLELLGAEEEQKSKQLIESLVAELNETYTATGRAFSIEAVAGGWRVLTRAEFNADIEALRGERMQAKLSHAALETLAIIAYRQPILRAELEAIRGVACGEVLRSLLDRRLVRITGRAELVGRPMLYGTSREFLQTFGLAGLDDLPKIDGAAARS